MLFQCIWIISNLYVQYFKLNYVEIDVSLSIVISPILLIPRLFKM